MIHERLGGDVIVDGIGVPKLANLCILNGVDDEGTKSALGRFVQLEIMPQQFVDSLRALSDNSSGVIRDGQVGRRPCGGANTLRCCTL